jgi:ribosomal protein S15P/S13E
LETRKEAIQPNQAIPLPQVCGRHSPQARKPKIHPKEEPPSQTINLNQKAPMKIHIKKNPHDLETKEGNSQMVSEKQPMANQDEWKLRQLDWKMKLGREHSRKQN